MFNPKIDPDGTKYWFNKNNQRHREDGPAIIFTKGTKYWYKNDELHRDDGPAIEWANGLKEWFLNGKQYTESEFRVLQFTKGVDCVYPSN